MIATAIAIAVTWAAGCWLTYQLLTRLVDWLARRWWVNPPRPRPVEETRLMPRAEQRDLGDEDEPVTEGLGIVRPRRMLAERFPKLTPAQLAAVARRRAQEHVA